MPSDSEGGILFGLSAFRLAGAAILIAWTLLALVFAYFSKRRPALQENLDATLTSRLGNVLLTFSLLVALLCQGALAVLWGLSQNGAIFEYAAYAVRLAPLFNLATLTGFELVGWVVLKKWQIYRSTMNAGEALLRKAIIVWAILGALAVLIAITGLGIVPDETGEWGLPGVALLEWQIVLACLVSILTFLLEGRRQAIENKRVDFWISVGIWTATLFLWLSQPVIPSFSALPPRAPNFEIYPFSDAQVYDEFAQSLLIGNGLKGNEIPPRPLYIVFLALWHLIVGQDYNAVIAAQSLALALFPVALYWVGKELYGRPVGIAVALLAGLRDYTSNIAAPFSNAISYSKLYLSEMPVALALAAFTYLAIRWARADHPSFRAFVAGGALGAGILIRTQAVAALPLILFVAWMAERKRFMPIVRGGLLMILAVVLMISPWLIRNWVNTGELIFDSPFTQTINLAQRYSRINGVEADAIRKPGENNIAYNERLLGIFVDAVSQNPGEAARVVVNRFLGNCVNNVLLMPLRNDLNSLDELWRPNRAFWEEWNGALTLSQSLLLAFYTLLLGLGIAAAWGQMGLLGLAPLFINLAYNLWTSFALLGGQRFLVAMDWSIYTYYMIGLFVLIRGFISLMESAPASNLTRTRSLHRDVSLSSADPKPRPWTHFLVAGAFFLLVGASVPLSEKIFPKKYPPLTQAQLFDEFTSSKAFEKSAVNSACLAKVVADNGLTTSRGRALSPRFYESGEGEFTDKFGYKPSEQSRLLFYMTGDYYGLILLEMTDAPEFFPHASDVIVYRDREVGQKAWFALVSDNEEERLYFSDTVNNPCIANP